MNRFLLLTFATLGVCSVPNEAALPNSSKIIAGAAAVVAWGYVMGKVSDAVFFALLPTLDELTPAVHLQHLALITGATAGTLAGVCVYSKLSAQA